jgi:hypothetical protein
MIGDFKTGNRVASPLESLEEEEGRSISIIREGGMAAAGLA